MTDPFDQLLAAHVAALDGSLLDGLLPGPDGAGYVHSRAVPDPTLNFAVGVRAPEQFAWAGATAHARGREPAFLARDAEEAEKLCGLFAPAARFPASWMLAGVGPATPTPPDAFRVERHAGPAPPRDFERVFLRLSREAAVRNHLRRHYLPALRAARARPGLGVVHLVAHDATGPAACASLYLRGELAGLYSVSTRADRQRLGLGARITAAALHEAAARGAAQVFLQCPAAGPVEALYARAGFGIACAPVLLCTALPG